MKYLIGHDSALEYWRTHDRGEQCPTRANARFADPPCAKLLESPALAGWASLPLHVVVTEPGACCQIDGVACRMIRQDALEGAILRIGQGLYVPSPEACFLQMASRVDLISLIQIGFELCGSYGPDFAERAPRTSVRKIAGYLRGVHRVHGVKEACRAVGQIVDGSGSPMETMLTMLLCLPTSVGGYGLPKPLLNCPVKCGGKTFRSDLCWPDFGFALEYDSNRFHSGRKKLNKDSIRRARIELAQVHTISVTWEQLRDPFVFDELVQVAARHVGYRLRTTRKDALARRFALRRQLFNSPKA